MYRVILLDIDNTILSFDAYVEQAMKEGFEMFGYRPYEEWMLPKFFEINNGLWQRIEQGTLDFAGLIKIRWNTIFPHLGIEGDGIEFEKYFRQKLNVTAIPIDGSYELLEHLSSKYKIYAASNGPFDQQVTRIKLADMEKYFSGYFISDAIGASKPSIDFFNACFEGINADLGEEIAKEDILIIGDSLTSDMAGGITSGIHTMFYNPKNKAVPEDIKLNYVVNTLHEITDLI